MILSSDLSSDHHPHPKAAFLVFNFVFSEEIFVWSSFLTSQVLSVAEIICSKNSSHLSCISIKTHLYIEFILVL
jgi:hypothetical protein